MPEKVTSKKENKILIESASHISISKLLLFKKFSGDFLSENLFITFICESRSSKLFNRKISSLRNNLKNMAKFRLKKLNSINRNWQDLNFKL